MSKVNCEAVEKRRQASLRMAQAELLHTIAKEINNHPFSNNDCSASAIAFLNVSTDMPAFCAPRSME